MCGIAGIVTQSGSAPDEALLRRMSEAVRHRGPDGDGIWIAPGVGLAHRRLAIIDLSREAAQPMHDASGDLTIVFNGEIYNYRELRRELEARGASFRTHSDTEVILEAFRAWGRDAFVRLRGMFALAIWDARERRLLLARDKIGKKPLFYAFTPRGDFVFASEIKALAPVIALAPDWNAVRVFLGLQYVPSPLTGFQDVKQLLPGEIGARDRAGWNTEMYHTWNAQHSPFVACNDPQSVDERIRERLEDAVKIRLLAADVPVGAFLSGGIDSAAVVAFASRHVSQPLQTFTMGFSLLHLDERTEAREIAKTFGTDHHEFEARPEHLAMLLDELLEHYDAPYADSSALPVWLLARETAREIKVVLTGDGGDELFGGYRRYAAYAQAMQLARVPFLSSLCKYYPSSRISSFFSPRIRRFVDTVCAAPRDPARAYGELFCGSYFNSRSLRELCDPAFLETTKEMDAVKYVVSHLAPVREDSPLARAMFFDLTSYLPDDLNVKMDRATMRWGLEARAPFLDEEVVAFARCLPVHEYVRRGRTKAALRRALRGILPERTLQLKKRGFQVPLAEWFRGPLLRVLRERILDPQSPLARVVRCKAVEQLMQEHLQGRDHGNRLWMLLSLATWLARVEQRNA